jgi:predicted RNA-binding protein with PUA-like domain
MKSEPEDFSIQALRKKAPKTEPWTGVRNYQARNYLQSMKPGDRVLFHHSNASPSGIAGLAEVVSEPFPDPTALDPRSHYFDPKVEKLGNRWRAVNVRFVEEFPRILPLEELREIPGLEEMVVIRKGSRLSVQPVTAKEYKIVTAWIKKNKVPPK